ncbi:hypothetical protein VTP01DRAFT_3941 [Rhizomucor pusillus]|uniref:uncharacterized protein n=1 Tax=Rhizomucor pusillus TaxID=4840 RepID=UPI0037431795
MMLDTEYELYGVISSITRIGCHFKVVTTIQHNGCFIAVLDNIQRPGIKVLKDSLSDDDDAAIFKRVKNPIIPCYKKILEIHYCEANEWKKLLKRSCSDNIGLQFHSFVYLHISTWMGEEISSYHQP